jgi:indole-3-glycerol phosphate synthase
MNDILKNISKTKLEYVEKCKIKRPLAEVEGLALKAPPVRGFINSLLRAKKAGNFGLITEIKKASPSKGLIREDFNPQKLAKAYQMGGASCLSILTDNPYFMGTNKDLVDARLATTLPVLRKDFILDPYQVIESRALGADCILIIMAMVDDNLAAELEAVALEYNLDVLVEVHDANELKRADKLQSMLITKASFILIESFSTLY